MAESVQIQQINYRHEAIIDHMIAFPDRKLGQIAEDLGYTQPWLSTVIHSDAFRVEYRRRRDQHNQDLGKRIQGQLLGIATQSLDRIDKYLETGNPSPRFCLDAADRSLHRLGFGPSNGKQMIINGDVTVNSVDKELFSQARERIRLVHSQLKPQAMIEADAPTDVEKSRSNGTS
jgi:hypothetical protein